MYTFSAAPPKEIQIKSFQEELMLTFLLDSDLVLKIFSLETQGSDQSSAKAL